MQDRVKKVFRLIMALSNQWCPWAVSEGGLDSAGTGIEVGQLIPRAQHRCSALGTGSNTTDSSSPVPTVLSTISSCGHHTLPLAYTPASTTSSGP